VSLSDSSIRTLHRLVFPTDPQPGAGAVLPLYVEGPARPDLVLGRTAYRVEAGERVSFAAYFNAFPAAYWLHWTDVEQVTLSIELAGDATVEVVRSDADGRARPVTTERVAGPRATWEATVPLAGFDEGGWAWFEITAHGDVEVRSARWTDAGPQREAAEPTPPARGSVGITTYNRVGSCLALLRQLGEDPGLREVLDRVYVVDQGEQRVSESPHFADAVRGLGDRLSVLEQANLGGSGGFARCQLETLRAGCSDHLVILDDDVVLETESLRRALVFAARCTVPTLVGAQMLSLPEPTRLYAMAEQVDLRRFFWGPKRGTPTQHDLAGAGLRDAGWLHRREDVNYNGWWMCLIPRAVLEKVGLSLPFFIRWDDAEYGLRAGEAGFPTVTLPGVAVWHVPWTHKTDALDWQAYFHQRNRIISALLHSPHERGGLLVPELLAHQLKQTASMQYSTAELRLLAIADVLEGPEGLHPALLTKPAQARRLLAGYPDADVRAGPEGFPAPARPATAAPRRTPRWLTAVTGVARQLLPVSDRSRRTPQVHLPAAEAHWSQLLKYDSAVVSTADGSGAVWYRRDRAMFSDIARRSLTMHRRLHREWPGLAARYRTGVARLASPAAWHDTFESTARKGKRGPA
jgi:galactofuranosylgalactofuranosylrhamnosyl-N-acetylglucosaminyl-diphospho-decaprenol beta-1,5/1,6-galactofuranosyltransferase